MTDALMTRHIDYALLIQNRLQACAEREEGVGQCLTLLGALIDSLEQARDDAARRPYQD